MNKLWEKNDSVSNVRKEELPAYRCLGYETIGRMMVGHWLSLPRIDLRGAGNERFG